MAVKVLQVSDNDVTGGRFNNFAIRHLLRSQGVDAEFLVWNKQSAEDWVTPFFNFRGLRASTRLLSRGLRRIEDWLSVHSRLQVQAFATPLLRAFRDADVVHYHLIHNGFFSLDALPFLTRLKPSVWTWHDPYPMTGHCVHPLGCGRWQTGCGSCPSLSAPLSLRRDRTAEQFVWKKGLMRSVEARLVVASPWMQRMAHRSPIVDGRRIEVLPFGIDLQRFRPVDSSEVRSRLGIAPGQVVVGVRSLPGNPYKGFGHVVEAMRGLAQKKLPITILTTQEPRSLEEFKPHFQIIDLGWITDEDRMRDVYAAMDIFLMPSEGEAFGVMAIEAMACGKTVVVLEGTALPETAGAPEVAVAVPPGDFGALVSVLERLVRSPEERRRRGEAGRKLAELKYGDSLFAERLAAVYRDVLSCRNAGALELRPQS